MPRLSVILIARNEEVRLPAALASVQFADEVIVVDGGSTDATARIARDAGAKVEVRSDWQGFGPQKNRALELATGDWVLSIDCDERVSEEGREEVLRTISQPTADAYEMPRLSSMCGRAMRHSGWWPDHVTRLFRRGTARFSDDLVHERLLTNGPIGRLQHPLLHEGYRTIEDALSKMNRYSSDGAANLRRRGRNGGAVVAALRGAWMFVLTYVLRAGFLDGREGFLIAVINAENTFWRYAKLGYPDPQATAQPQPTNTPARPR
ncbi:MAG: glycosyltransferase family 2 protein [Phycisphaerae bacterium]|jgi:glycosyltransferase involved in cell wall biosynthesis|nr:glycosyltransferase family 2 protein [Phycisphaerae bacterium]